MAKRTLWSIRNEVGLLDGCDLAPLSVTLARKAIHLCLVYCTNSRVKGDGAAFVARYMTKCNVLPPEPHEKWTEECVREFWSAEDATLLERSRSSIAYQKACDRVRKEISS